MLRRLAVATLIGLALLSAASCGLLDPTAPALIDGSVLDLDRRPVPGATVSIVVEDVPVELLDMVVTTGADGRFTVLLAPNDALRAHASRNGGTVGFSLSATLPDGGFGGGWTFSRQPAQAGWAGPVPRVVLSREGSEAAP